MTLNPFSKRTAEPLECPRYDREFGCGGCTAVGVPAGTRVQSNGEWRAVTSLQVGDFVDTFDSGPQRIIDIRVNEYGSRATTCPKAFWPFAVPPQALGNIDPMLVLPDDHVILESSGLGLDGGDCFGRVPVRALTGFRGIRAVSNVPVFYTHVIVLDAPELLCVAGGAYVTCGTPRQMAPSLHDPTQATRVFNYSETRKLLDWLAEDCKVHVA
jgi:hypothetical protein